MDVYIVEFLFGLAWLGCVFTLSSFFVSFSARRGLWSIQPAWAIFAKKDKRRARGEAVGGYVTMFPTDPRMGKIPTVCAPSRLADGWLTFVTGFYKQTPLVCPVAG